MAYGSYARRSIRSLGVPHVLASVQRALLCSCSTPAARMELRPRRRREPSSRPPVHHGYALRCSHSDSSIGVALRTLYFVGWDPNA